MDGLKYLFLEDRDQPLPSWMAELEDTLECPICLKTILDPPIHQCENGHYYCSTCHGPIKNEGEECPVCRGQLVTGKNLMVAKMLEKLPKTKCRYEDCQFERVEVGLVHQHETDCLFRLVECADCEEGIPLTKLSDHILKVHGVEMKHEKRSGVEYYFTLPIQEFWTSSLCHDQDPFKLDDQIFFFNYLTEPGHAMFWVSFCGSPKEAEEYEYSLKIISSADRKAGRTKYLFTGIRQCVSCDVSHRDMEEGMEALIIDKKLLVKAAEGHNENELEINLKITKQQ